jgi:hypothetical protein
MLTIFANILLLFTSPQNVYVIHAVAGDVAVPINAAVASCPSSGCTIEIPNGSYRLSKPILVTKQHVTIKCDSPATMATSYSSTSLSPDGYYYGVIDVKGDFFTMEGCSIDVSSILVALSAIHLFSSSHSRITKNVISSRATPVLNAMIGIRVEGNGKAHIVSDDVFSGNTLEVPYIAMNVGDYSQQKIIFDGNTASRNYEGFDFNGGLCGGACPGPNDSFGIQFTNNEVTGQTNSSYVQDASDVLIAHNHFLNSGSPAFASIRVLQATSRGMVGVTIDNNQFSGGAGPGVHIYQNAQHWIVSNNSFDHMGDAGILVDASVGDPEFGVITNNTLRNNRGCGIVLKSARIGSLSVGAMSISGNRAWDDQSVPTQKHGLCSDGPAPFSLLFGVNDWTMSLPNGCKDCTTR